LTTWQQSNTESNLDGSLCNFHGQGRMAAIHLVVKLQPQTIVQFCNRHSTKYKVSWIWLNFVLWATFSTKKILEIFSSFMALTTSANAVQVLHVHDHVGIMLFYSVLSTWGEIYEPSLFYCKIPEVYSTFYTRCFAIYHRWVCMDYYRNRFCKIVKVL
jgi:hypothetical protein